MIMNNRRFGPGHLMVLVGIATACTGEPVAPTPDRPNASVAPDAAASFVAVFGPEVPDALVVEAEALGVSLELTASSLGVEVANGANADGLEGLARRHGATIAGPAGRSRVDARPAQTELASLPSAVVPTPAFLPLQWNMPAIEAQAGWAPDLERHPVRVAILDSGIDYLHPDLAGLVDLTASTSFVPSDDALVAAAYPGRHPITDLHGHGTAVASNVVSNRVLVAGITQKTTLIGVKVCDHTGDCLEDATLLGIVHAVDAGADIINMSVGAFGGSFEKADKPGYVSSVNRAINYATQHGVLIVVAAGNQSRDLDHDQNDYVAYCDSPHVMCVAGTGPTSGGLFGPWSHVDTPYLFTNFGRSAIDVAAPSGNFPNPPVQLGGAVWGACSTTTMQPDGPFPWTTCLTRVTAAALVGTSLSAPHVSGLAALLKAATGAHAPRLRQWIRHSAEDLGHDGNDPYFGHGRVNVAAALAAAGVGADY